MQIARADAELLTRLDAAGLNAGALDPWEAWKVFKGYLAVPVDQPVYDAASFQCGIKDGPEFRAFFVRQFSEWEGERDAGIRHVVVELIYAPGEIGPSSAAEVWTHDYQTLAEFASVVEGLPQFQSITSVRPTSTEVYSEEI